MPGTPLKKKQMTMRAGQLDRKAWFLLLVFAITLVVAILLSELADRSILSTAVLFLARALLLGAVV